MRFILTIDLSSYIFLKVDTLRSKDSETLKKLRS